MPPAAARVVLMALALQHLAIAVAATFAPLLTIELFRDAGAVVGHRYMVSEYSIVWRTIAAGASFGLAFMLAWGAQNAAIARPFACVAAVAQIFASAAFAVVFVFFNRYAPLLGLSVWFGLGAILGMWSTRIR